MTSKDKENYKEISKLTSELENERSTFGQYRNESEGKIAVLSQEKQKLQYQIDQMKLEVFRISLVKENFKKIFRSKT